MSALPPKADIVRRSRDVRFVPTHRHYGSIQILTMPTLPIDKMRQHFTCCFAVADEIIIYKINPGRMSRLFQHLIQFVRNLLGRLEPGLAAVERGDVTEFAAIGAATRKLQAPDEIMIEMDQVVCRQREVAER